MIEDFLAYVMERSQVAKDELCSIAAVCSVRKLRKGQYLLQEKQVWRHVAFVTKGCLRTFSIDNEGKEHTVYFAMENWWTGDRQSFLTGESSQLNVEALEDSEVIMIGKESFDKLCGDLPAFNEMINTILQRSFVAYQNRIQAFVSMSAKQNYLRFIEQFPGLATRVPQNMIASYLGIAPETLSRIRRTLKPKPGMKA